MHYLGNTLTYYNGIVEDEKEQALKEEKLEETGTTADAVPAPHVDKKKSHKIWTGRRCIGRGRFHCDPVIIVLCIAKLLLQTRITHLHGDEITGKHIRI